MNNRTPQNAHGAHGRHGRRTLADRPGPTPLINGHGMSLRVLGPNSQQTPRTPYTNTVTGVGTVTTTSRGITPVSVTDNISRYVPSPKLSSRLSGVSRSCLRRNHSLDFLTSPEGRGGDLSTRAQRYSPAAANICKALSRTSSSGSTTDIINEVEDLCLVGSDSIAGLSSPRYLFPSDCPEEFELNPITPFQREEDPLEVDPSPHSSHPKTIGTKLSKIITPDILDDADVLGLEKVKSLKSLKSLKGTGDESPLLEMYVYWFCSLFLLRLIMRLCIMERAVFLSSVCNT